MDSTIEALIESETQTASWIQEILLIAEGSDLEGGVMLQLEPH
jgi:hypothetical protein